MQPAAVGEGHARHLAIGAVDADDLRVGADLEALRPAVGGDRLGDRAHAAADEAPAARARVLAHQVVRDDIGRPRAPRPDEGADAAVVGEHRLDVGALEPLRQVVVGAHREQIDEPEELAAHAAVLPQERRRLPERLPVAARGIGRRVQQDLAQDHHRFHQVAVELGVDRGVLRREAREVLLRLLDRVAEHDVVAAPERTEHVGGGQHLEAVAAEIEVGDHLRVQQAHQVAEHAEPEAGDDLLGDRGPADHVAALEHDGAQSRAREVAAAHESVVAATEDDGVVAVGHWNPPVARRRQRKLYWGRFFVNINSRHIF